MKAQLSIELLAVMAAYFALIAAFASFELDFGKKAESETGRASAVLKAQAVCAVIDEFASSGRNTAIDLGDFTDGVSASGKTVFYQGANATCNSAVRSEGGLKVEQSKREHV